jgi:3'-phosphoadenosine 5'-phosphosulfate (PAPS) 3'-phosphatase
VRFKSPDDNPFLLQLYISLGPKNEWDIAAGVLLVSEAGGVVTDTKREKFIFNQRQTLVDGIVATTIDMNDKIFALFTRIPS